MDVSWRTWEMLINNTPMTIRGERTQERGDGGGSAGFPETLSSSPSYGYTDPIDSPSHASIESSYSGSDWNYHRNAGDPQGPKWIGLLTTGVLLIIFGFVLVAMVSSADNSNYLDPFAEQDRQFDNATNAIGGIMIFGGFVFILVSFFVKSHEDSMAWRMSEDMPEAPEPVQERRVIEEVIKVRCRYCGTLNEVNSKHCTSCGAVL